MKPEIRESIELRETRNDHRQVTEKIARDGLTAERARQLLAEVGPNRLVPGNARPSALAWLLRALADPMVELLLVAGSTYLALGDRFDAIVILVAIVPIVAVGLLLEARAERALDQ